MSFFARHRLVAIVLMFLLAVEAAAQQAALQQPVQQQGVGQAPQQPVTPQVPAGFQLNALQQAEIDRVLDAWQLESGKITTFQCPFQRWEYDVAFGPKDKNIPLNKNLGELSYHKPDKGSFQITAIHTFREEPAPGQKAQAIMKGDWARQPDAIGEHWVCDGKSVYEYRHDRKQLVERPIPPQLQGQAIVDGPLPFLFGAEAAKLKQRYWMKLDDRNKDPNQIWIVALPKFREQAADFVEVDIILDPRNRLLPSHMQVWMPNGSHHVYIFDINNAKVNNLLDRVQALFERPRVPVGWKRVVENVPFQQAAKPADAPR